MTADLAQVALAFARECLGWEHPTDRRFSEQNLNATGDAGSKAWTPYIFDYFGKNGQFHYTDLSEVMAAVRAWAARNAVIPKIEVHPERVIVSIYTRKGEFLGSEYYPDLCQGLLVASVNAARKLKAL